MIWETRKYRELKEEAEDQKKNGDDSLSIEHKEEIQVIFHKSIWLANKQHT